MCNLKAIENGDDYDTVILTVIGYDYIEVLNELTSQSNIGISESNIKIFINDNSSIALSKCLRSNKMISYYLVWQVKRQYFITEVNIYHKDKYHNNIQHNLEKALEFTFRELDIMPYCQISQLANEILFLLHAYTPAKNADSFESQDSLTKDDFD